MSREDRIYNEIEALTSNKDELRENTPNESQIGASSHDTVPMGVDQRQALFD